MMTLFAEKEVFNLLGLEAIDLCSFHTSQDCTICTQPLDLQTNPAQKDKNQSEHHKAVRIIACSHVVGQKCLDVWLDTSHRCPVCRRELFEAKGAVIAQQDVDEIVHSLGRYFGKHKVMASVARVTTQVGGGKYILRRLVRVGAMQYAPIRRDAYRAYGVGAWDSDEDMDFEDEEEDEDYNMELYGDYESEDKELGGNDGDEELNEEDEDEEPDGDYGDEEWEDYPDSDVQEEKEMNEPGSAK